MDNDELNELVSELKNTQARNVKVNNKIKKDKESSDLTEDNLSDYILGKSKELIEKGLEIVSALQQDILFDADVEPEKMNALSDLMKTTVKSVEAINKIHIQNIKEAGLNKRKKIDIAAKKELNALQQNKALPSPQVNLLIASRDDVIKQIKQTPDRLDETVLMEKISKEIVDMD